MRGQVSDDGREALLTLTVASPDPTGRMVEVAATLDTGFTADLALPADVIGTLQLPELGTVDVALADGAACPVMPECRAEAPSIP